MTLEQEWRVAKWLEKRGKVVIAQAPKWIQDIDHDPKRFYSVRTVRRAPDGYGIPSEEDYLFVTDSHRDLISAEQERRDAISRSKKSLWIALAALMLSLVSIAWQICTWIAATT